MNPTITQRSWRLLPINLSGKTNGSIRNLAASSRSNNPYLILGIPPSSSFRTVQKAFNKLAFQYHPDTTGNTSVRAEFVQIRQAYESIRNAKGGKKGPKWRDDTSQNGDPTPHAFTEADFLDHFHRQTGVRLTSDQRREMVHLYRSRVQGGYYGGHSWDLARRLVAEQDAFLNRMAHGGPAKRDSSFEQAKGVGLSATGECSSAGSLRRPRKR